MVASKTDENIAEKLLTIAENNFLCKKYTTNHKKNTCYVTTKRHKYFSKKRY